MKGMAAVYLRDLARALLQHRGDKINSGEISLLVQELAYPGVTSPYDYNGPRQYLQIVGAITRDGGRLHWQLNRQVLERITEGDLP